MPNCAVTLEAEGKKIDLRIFKELLQVESPLSNLTKVAIEWKKPHWNFSIFEFCF